MTIDCSRSKSASTRYPSRSPADEGDHGLFICARTGDRKESPRVSFSPRKVQFTAAWLEPDFAANLHDAPIYLDSPGTQGSRALPRLGGR